MLARTAASYVLAHVINRSLDKRSDIALYISLALTLGALIYLKYFNFIAENFRGLFHIQAFKAHHVTLEAIGLSFIVFPITAYLLDVFCEAVPAEKSFTN